MQKNLKWKLFLILAVMLVCLYFFVSPRPGSGDGLMSRINLGLDLKGGYHLVLQVVTDDAVNQDLNQDAQRITQDLQAKSLTIESGRKGDGYSVEITGVPATSSEPKT